MGRFSLIFKILFFSGCAGSGHWTWQHPEKQGELLLLQDKKICRELAQSEVKKINYFYDYYSMYRFPFFSPFYGRRHYKPYAWNQYHSLSSIHHYSFLQQQDDLERFFRICMQSKGWERIKIETEKPETE